MINFNFKYNPIKAVSNTKPNYNLIVNGEKQDDYWICLFLQAEWEVMAGNYEPLETFKDLSEAKYVIMDLFLSQEILHVEI